MSEDWLTEDPFAEVDDPAATERERRRREREERRRGGAAEPLPQAVEAAAPPPAPAPRTPAPPSGSPAAPLRRRPRLVAAAAIAGAVVLVAAAALAYRHFHRSAPAVALKTVTVTIPEGYDRAQTARLAREDGLRGSYMKASARSRYLDPAHYGGRGARSLEGFLFPDTFELEAGAPAADLVQLQIEDFKRRLKGVDMRYARSKNLTAFDVVSIASMIEREAQLESQRKLVAAVIYNRLHLGMPLGIDATVRFATGNYARPLTEAQLAVHSPYNTRLHGGLPPGPIDSPGLASLEAAAHPARVDYLYYVNAPGACGRLVFSSTAAQFEQDAARYRAAGGAGGGESRCGR
jgi:cell division protein YceG involved in septum cleavage